jgi:hypothetical protein
MRRIVDHIVPGDSVNHQLTRLDKATPEATNFA